MKLLRILPLLAIATFLSACGGDDDGNGNEGAPVVNNNSNKNDALHAGLEFPRLRNGNSTVVTHTTSAFGTTYSLEWDHKLKAQRWTCYYFTKDNKVKKWQRSNWKGATWEGKYWTGDPFQKDPDVPNNEQPSVTGEFSGSSYPDKGFSYFQRGHMCASEDRVASQDANGQTFYMTNMMPQGDLFNGKLWSKMEAFVRDDWGRKITSASDTLFVVKGGTIDSEDKILCRTRSGFIVPRYFFMALLLKKGSSYQAMGFWVEHINEDHSNDKLSDYMVNIRELEEKTCSKAGNSDGIDFFCNLPDDIEQSVETMDHATIMRVWDLNNK